MAVQRLNLCASTIGDPGSLCGQRSHMPHGVAKKKKKSNKPFFPSGSVVRNLSANSWDAGDGVQSLGWEDPLDKGMTTYSSVLAWRTPGMEEPGGLPSMGSHRVGQDWTWQSGYEESVYG